MSLSDQILMTSNIPSNFVSRYWPWFKYLGYPQLDMCEYEDGSWDIIEYHNAPIIPSMTSFRTILGNMQHVEKSFSFIDKYIRRIDPALKELWDIEEKKTELMYEAHEAADQARDELVNRMTKLIVKSDSLKEKFLTYGPWASHPISMAQNIPKRLFKANFKRLLA